VRASPASGLQTAAHGLQTASHGLQTADAGLQTASHGLQTAAHGLQTTSHGLQTADAGLQTASHGLQTAGDGKPPSTGVAPCASNLADGGLTMRTDFVKRRDREFEAQVAQFLANLGPVKTALGLPANWEAQLQTRKNNFTTALASSATWELAERVGRQGHLVSRGVGDAARSRCSTWRRIPPRRTFARGAWSDPARATVAG
jgi:uncharacterized phage infection (PIP) family protein YhgE